LLSTVWAGLARRSWQLHTLKATRADYSAIFWLNIKDEDSLKQSYARVAKRDLAGASFSQLAAVHSSLEDSKPDEVGDALSNGGWITQRTRNG
jgi:hypothetical protein